MEKNSLQDAGVISVLRTRMLASAVGGVALLAGSMMTPTANASTLTWDSDGVPTNGATDGTGTWESSNWYDGVSADSAYTPGSDVIFGAGGTAGTVTLNAAETADTLTLNPTISGNYTITGNLIGFSNTNASSTYATYGVASIIVNQSATIGSQLGAAGALVKGIAFATGGQTLTLSGGSLTANNAFLTGISGVGTGGNSGIGNNLGGIYGAGSSLAAAAAIGATSSVVITAGTYSASAAPIGIGDITTGTGGLRIQGGIFNEPGNVVVGGFGSDSGVIVIEGGTVSTTGGTGSIEIGRSLTGTGTGSRLDITSGSLLTKGSIDVGKSGNVTNGTAQLNISGGTTTTVNLSAGSGLLNLNNGTTGGSFTSTVNISGGTTTFGAAGGIAFNPGSNRGASTLNMSGGTVYLGSAGITSTGTGTSTAALNYSGGTVGAVADWSSSVPATITGGAVTFQAADAGGTAHNITLSGVLSGAGGLTKTGAGALTLSGENTYAGDTTISAGTVNSSFADLSDTANVVIASTALFNLNFATADSIAGLIVDGTPLAAGTYVASGNTAAFPGSIGESFLGGTGALTVVPEPVSMAFLSVGALGLLRRRRRA